MKRAASRQGPRDSNVMPLRDVDWLERSLSSIRAELRAPRGFTDRVMSTVYREALVPRPQTADRHGAAARSLAADAARRPFALRLYRRIAVSLMLTAVVLAASLLVPHVAYPSLIGTSEGATFGHGPSDAVRSALVGASTTVQGALGERLIEGGQQ